MHNKYDYEWDVEVLDEDGDIAHMFCGSAREAIETFNREGPPSRVVLVWSEGNDDDGVKDRAWAYLDEKMCLPEFFAKPTRDNEYRPILQRVPKRFHEELRKAVA